MQPEEIILTTADYIKEKFAGEGSGHDWWHIYRVWQNALYLAKNEQADLLVVQLGALLHDVADWKFYGGDETVGEKMAREYLEKLQVPELVIAPVCQIINEISFKGAGVNTPMSTLEGAIVQDADRLDAIGAIGIARAFAYGGFKHREMHNPNILPENHTSFAAYKKNTGPTINHFYEKLLLLKDRMNTATGRQLAEDRHQYMLNFLEQFYQEWNINVELEKEEKI
ncbi:HD domain-containing protein [Adhaeribacter rhizoryzae]|uniref:HD domain-containing protein n=1 Tax=Adhaeribacter rhizoryzae TaxID=2607907 RepID=A0A5M6DJP4_9BACT|nr:HD domain-containing protein [Adhaeribacter rhizoryzae]KAA5547777.1 HD domain-containing protein [Adhaeribacter rhizoryzae]